MTEQSPVEIKNYNDTPIKRDEIFRVLTEELGVMPPAEEWRELSDYEILEYLQHLAGYFAMSVEEMFEAVGIDVTDGDTGEVR